MVIVNSIESLGTHEGPGLRTVIFTQGCNLKCLYCHNPETQPQYGGKKYSKDEIVNIILKSKSYYGKKGGITFSGGEPLLQAKAITPIFEKMNKLNISTAIDTSGSLLNDDVKELLKFTNLVLLDIKHIDNEKHKNLTGISNKIILKFARFLEENKIKFWIRFVLVSEYTDDSKNINELGNHFKNYKMVERLEILPYHTLGIEKYKKLSIEYKLKNIKPPSPEKIQSTKEILEKYFAKVVVR
jgi:pyruvate formate lyase activating enzyme